MTNSSPPPPFQVFRRGFLFGQGNALEEILGGAGEEEMGKDEENKCHFC